MTKLNNILAIGSVFSLLGFIDASYLTIKHYTGAPIPCSLLNGCDVVTTSIYSSVYGIPVALIGSLYYLFLIFCLVYFFDKGRPWAIKAALAVSSLGLLISAVLIYLQVAIIKALCLYCLTSAAITLVLFVIFVLANNVLIKSLAFPVPNDSANNLKK